MKKLVAGLVVLFLIGVGGSVITISASGGLNFNTADLNQSETIDGDFIQNISVESASTDVSIREAAGQGDIKVALTGKVSKKLKDDYKLKVSEKNGTLDVDLEVENIFRMGVMIIRDVKIEIIVPEKKFDTLAVQVSSGDIQADSLKSKEMKLETKSGDLMMKDLGIDGALEVHVASGDVKISDSSAKDLKFKATSGDMMIDGISAGSANLYTASGDIKIKDLTGEILAKITSGDLNISNEKASGSITAETASGDVNISFKEKPGDLAVDFKANSGEGNVQLDGFLFEEKEEDRIRGKIGSGEHLVKVNTLSGDFNLD
jgi:lia operon protein LiaG